MIIYAFLRYNDIPKEKAREMLMSMRLITAACAGESRLEWGDTIGILLNSGDVA